MIIEKEGLVYELKSRVISMIEDPYYVIVYGNLDGVEIGNEVFEEIEDTYGKEICHVEIGNIDSKVGKIRLTDIKYEVWVYGNGINSVEAKGCENIKVRAHGSVNNLDLECRAIDLRIKKGSEVGNLQIKGGGVYDEVRIDGSKVKKFRVESRDQGVVEVTNAEMCYIGVKFKEDGLYFNVCMESQVEKIEASNLSTLSVTGSAYISKLLAYNCRGYECSLNKTVGTMRVTGEIKEIYDVIRYAPRVMFMEGKDIDAEKLVHVEEFMSNRGLGRMYKHIGKEKVGQIERRREAIGDSGTIIYIE